MKLISPLVQDVFKKLDHFNWLAPLAARICIGWVFLEAGWGKLNNLEKVIGYFESLGIPAPGIQAPFVATLETFGGFLLIIGFGTRLISVPLMGTMVVALATAHAEDFTSLNDLLGLAPFLYLLFLGWLVLGGPGICSVDTLVKKKLNV